MKDCNDWVSKKQLCDKMSQVDGEKLVLFILDIDNSKGIFGESIDSKTLKQFLFTFKEVFGTEKSYFSQIGRDAFAGLFVCDNNYSLFDIMQQKLSFQSTISNNFETPELTTCMGVSIYPDICKKKEELFSFAYDALFFAKCKGPNSIESSTSENMKLKSLYFRKSQLDKLSYYSKKNNHSESEIIRRALDDYLNKSMYES
ncbi:GGDEF domain-containing protein [Bacillus thuringiensis]|uniref:GGDEF domain-containing protein n=1 Tax=Bacillus thuringiensis TaxID=1428 RepID=UPI00125F52BF|nr:GGDEF domain-containing protein [Bacillus thuringiensis]KAB5636932.1 GGDEF domain-containing protein [Bacillus thuringiensis]HDR5271687.1 GGDEF domain-containing protein [Bacillus thuringiensis]